MLFCVTLFLILRLWASTVIYIIIFALYMSDSWSKSICLKLECFRWCLTFLGMATRRNVQYSRLRNDEDYDGNATQYDPRFDYTPKSFDRIPWKSIALALFLLFLGLTLLFLAYFILTGHMGGDRSQAYGLLALGILTSLPGMKTFFLLFLGQLCYR